MRHLKESKTSLQLSLKIHIWKQFNYTEALQDYLNKPIHTFYKINIPKGIGRLPILISAVYITGYL